MTSTLGLPCLSRRRPRQLEIVGRVDDEKTYVITKDAPKEVELATRNMARVVHADITKLNVYDILNADKVVVGGRFGSSEFYGALEERGLKDEVP